MADGGGINLRIALRGAEQVKAELNQIGPAGQAMARQLDSAMRTPSLGMRAMDTAAAQAKGGLSNLAVSGGGLTSALSGLGPVGLAVGAGLAAAGLAATAAYQSFKNVAESADALVASADRIGLGVEHLQALRFAAGETDVEIASLEGGLQKLNGALGAMQSGVGSGKVKEAFAALKISRDDLASMNDAGDLLPLIADRIARIDSQAARVQILKKLGLAELEPLLRQGGESLKGYEDRARELGLVLSGDMAGGLADADRALEISSGRVDAAVARMQSALAPFFVWVAEKTASAIVGLSSLLDRVTTSESEQLQNIINRRAEIERGFGGRPMHARAQGEYDMLGAQANRINASRSRRAAAADARAKPDLDLDLPGGGGGGGGGGGVGSQAADAARRQAEEERRAADRARRLDQVGEALYRARADELASAIDGATTLEQRQKLETQRLNIEQQRARLEQAAFIKEGEIDATSAKELKAALERTQITERAVLIQRQRQDIQAALRSADQAHEAMLVDILSAASSQARTAEAKREIELRILDIAQERFRAELQDKIATAETAQAKARYLAMLEDLPTREAAQRSQVLVQTAGPVEAWRASQRTPTQASQDVTRDALQALDGMNSGLIDAWKNATSLGDAFERTGSVAVDALGRVADALAEVALQRLLIQPLTDALFPTSGGGAGGFLQRLVGNMMGATMGGSGAGVAAGVGGVGGISTANGTVGATLKLLGSQGLMSPSSSLPSFAGPSSAPQMSLTINNMGPPVKATMAQGGAGQPILNLEPLLDRAVEGKVRSMGANGTLMSSLALTPQPRRR